MSEFIDGIEFMRQSALDRIAEADDLEHAAFMIKGTKFFFTPVIPDKEDMVDDN